MGLEDPIRRLTNCVEKKCILWAAAFKMRQGEPDVCFIGLKVDAALNRAKMFVRVRIAQPQQEVIERALNGIYGFWDRPVSPVQTTENFVIRLG